MTQSRVRVRASAFLAVSFALGARVASADPTKDQCVDADTQAQSLRRSGHLAAAREQLRTCVAQACPGLVRDDCSQRLDELEHAQPTIVFEAQDGAGHDLAAVTVRIDGRHWLDRLDGAAVPVDPGAHQFLFEAAGQVPLTQQFVIREGEKARHERIVFAAGASAASSGAANIGTETTAPAATPPQSGAPPQVVAPTPQSGGAAESASPPGQTQRTVGLVTGGVGIAGVVLGSVFGAIAASRWNSAKDECTVSNCPPASHAQAENDKSSASSAATISTVGFVAGAALVAGGVVLYLTAPSHSRASSGGLRVVPLFSAGSGGLRLEGGF